jgi:hypothetical protein
MLWQALIFAPLAAVRFGLTAAGLTKAAQDSDEIRMASLGDGFMLKSEAKAFRGGGIAWFSGGVVLDLRGATMAEGGADLRVVTVMGGFVLIVPPDWRVELEQRAIMAGASPVAEGAETGPVLHVTALTVMGGFNVLRRPAEATQAAAPAETAG